MSAPVVRVSLQVDLLANAVDEVVATRAGLHRAFAVRALGDTVRRRAGVTDGTAEEEEVTPSAKAHGGLGAKDAPIRRIARDIAAARRRRVEGVAGVAGLRLADALDASRARTVRPAARALLADRAAVVDLRMRR